jgi:indolepyruvate ferredoxin oxidoreductase beta subunit
MVPAGEADFLVVMAPDQVDNNRHVLKAGGVLISCDFVNEAELPSKRSLNIALIGVLSRHLDLPLDAWHAAVRAALPEKVHEANLRAFEIGREKARASKQ